jgi:putative membrane protein
MMLFGGLMMLLFWGGLIVLVVLVLRSVFRPPSDTSRGPGPAESSALETLKMRFARGEITAAEYEEARRVLET